MKRIKKTATNIFLIAFGLTFLFSCAFFDQQKQKETKEPVQKSPAVSKEPAQKPPEVKPMPKPKQEIKEPAQKPPAEEEQLDQKAAPKKQPAIESGSINQQQYYDMGMKYYSQEKYAEAKKSWQKVIKLGKRTELADKARENIKKVDQILKTLKEMSGQ